MHQKTLAAVVAAALGGAAMLAAGRLANQPQPPPTVTVAAEVRPGRPAPRRAHFEQAPNGRMRMVVERPDAGP